MAKCLLSTIMEQQNKLDQVYLVHFTDDPPAILYSLYYLITNLSYETFLAELKDPIFTQVKGKLNNLSKQEFTDVKNKVKRAKSKYFPKELFVIDAMLKVLGSFSTVEEVTQPDLKDNVKSIFFYVTDDLERNLPEHDIAQKSVVIKFDASKEEVLKARFKVIVYRGDHVEPDALQLEVGDLFDVNTYENLDHPIELQLVTDMVSVKALEYLLGPDKLNKEPQ